MNGFTKGAALLSAAPCFFWAAVGGAAFIFGMPNAFCHIPCLILLYPFTLFMLAVKAQSTKQAFFSGWFCAMVSGLGSLYWLVFPMLDVAGMPLVLAIPAVALLVGYLACYAGLSCLGIRGLALFFAGKSGSHPVLAAVLPALLGGLVLGGFEVVCELLFTGFPWLALGTAFSFTPLWAQGASLFGGHMLGALYASGACLVAAACLASARGRLVCLVSGLAIVSALPLFGLYRLQNAQPTPDSGSMHVVLAQGNVNQNEKWERAYQERTLDLYLGLSKDAVASLGRTATDDRPLLVLWPETSMPFYFEMHDDYAARLQNFAMKHRANLAFGTLGVRDASGAAGLFNRMYLITSDGRVSGQYDKEHLVPFGEYIPFSASIPYLENLLQAMSFSEGTGNIPLQLTGQEKPEGPKLGTLICYEAIFPALAQARVASGATLLINISNDGWFRKSSAPLQHFSQAIMRAIEQQRPLVRGTNTGISAVVDGYGNITARLDKSFEEGALCAATGHATEITLYHRLHPVPEIVLVVLALLSLLSYSAASRGNSRRVSTRNTLRGKRKK